VIGTSDSDHDRAVEILERLCQVLDLHPAELFAAPGGASQRSVDPSTGGS
jgi:hypothetical protein